MFNGIDLADVEVLADPSAFGKVLARKMFGVKEKCQLIDRILDPDPTKAVNRQPVDAETAELFKSEFCHFEVTILFLKEDYVVIC